MAKSKEGAIKKEIKDMLLKRGASFFPIPGGSYGMQGAPDMVACYRSRFIAIEGKTPTGVQAEAQKDREEWVLDSEGRYVLGRSVPIVEAVLDEIDREIEEIESLRKLREDLRREHSADSDLQ